MRVIGRENRMRARTQEAIFPYRCSRKMISAPAIYSTHASERYLHITRDAYTFCLYVCLYIPINTNRRYFDPGFDGGYVRCCSFLLYMGYSKARLKYINAGKIDGLWVFCISGSNVRTLFLVIGLIGVNTLCIDEKGNFIVTIRILKLVAFYSGNFWQLLRTNTRENIF